MANKIIRFFEFFYALPTLYFGDLPGDRDRLLLPTTLMGAATGAAWQTIILTFTYAAIKRENVTPSDYLVIGLLGLFPMVTNIVSGLYEWRKRKFDDNNLSNLEKKVSSLNKYKKSDNKINNFYQ